MLRGGIAGLATFLLMLATQPFLQIGWDEGYTLGREARIRLWLRALANPPAFAESWTPPGEELVQKEGSYPPRSDQVDSRWELLFEPKVVQWFWPFAREEPHGHPPFYAWLGLLGDVEAPGLADLPRARLGPMLLFSIAAGVLFGVLGSRWGQSAAWAALGAWVLQPRLFAEGHLATYDGILTSLWMLALIAFARSEDSVFSKNSTWIWRVWFGILLGCSAATKLTGWFLPIPLIAWALLYRSRKAAVTLLVGLGIATVVLFLLTPPWWSEPISGVARFLRSNLTRGKTIPISVLFLGKVYETPTGSLPWYNTIVWTVFVVPVGFLILSLIGAFNTGFRRPRDPLALLFLVNWGFLLTLRAAPHTPGHDGVRLFLPAFGMLVGMAAYGAKLCAESRRRGRQALLGLSLAEGVVSIAIMMPVPLSYYSPIVGMLPGATALGMEPTYYWDALSPEAKRWLTENTGPGESIRFATNPHSWLYLRRIGELPQRLDGVDPPGRRKWYVIQNRPGAFEESDRAIVREATPAFTVKKLGVPLIWIFPFEQAEPWLLKRSAPGH